MVLYIDIVLVCEVTSPHLVPETGIKPFQFDEVPHHLGVALHHRLVETALSKIVQVKLAVSKFGHEIRDNLQVASNGSKVKGIQKCLNHIRKRQKQYIVHTYLTIPHAQMFVPVCLHSSSQ